MNAGLAGSRLGGSAAVTGGPGCVAVVWLEAQPPVDFLPMAVPKQKQSRSRTHKRRSQHKIAPPALNACPQCHSPRRPHRVCSVCGTYAGREVYAPETAEASE